MTITPKQPVPKMGYNSSLCLQEGFLKHILIIDDHPLFSQGLQLLLGGIEEGLVVSSASKCRDAIDNFKEQAIDLILLDYHLPDAKDGSALVQIKKWFPKSIVVMLSSEESRLLILDTLDNGAAGFIPKSSSPEVLIAALQLVLSGGIYLPPLINKKDYLEERKSMKLTQRQWNVVSLAVKGMPNKMIAYELGIVESTVKAHLFSAYKKLGVNNRTEAVMVFASGKAQIS